MREFSGGKLKQKGFFHSAAWGEPIIGHLGIATWIVFARSERIRGNIN
jgi:hypothetical protein